MCLIPKELISTPLLSKMPPVTEAQVHESSMYRQQKLRGRFTLLIEWKGSFTSWAGQPFCASWDFLDQCFFQLSDPHNKSSMVSFLFLIFFKPRIAYIRLLGLPEMHQMYLLLTNNLSALCGKIFKNYFWFWVDADLSHLSFL